MRRRRYAGSFHHRFINSDTVRRRAGSQTNRMRCLRHLRLLRCDRFFATVVAYSADLSSQRGSQYGPFAVNRITRPTAILLQLRQDLCAAGVPSPITIHEGVGVLRVQVTFSVVSILC